MSARWVGLALAMLAMGEAGVVAAAPRRRPPPVPAPSPSPSPSVTPEPTPSPTPEPVDPAVARAKAAFAAADRAYNDGDYETAVREYKNAYEAKPHPSVLFNIGQAHERLVDYTQAVSYFERYLAEMGEAAPDRKAVENRVRALRSLPARVRVAAVPEDAVVTLHGQQDFQARPGELVKVPAGHYEVRVSKDGFETAVDEVVAEFGQPYSFSFRLVPETGRVYVTVQPRSARIFVDSKLVAEGSYVDRLGVGLHMVRAEANGRPPAETPILIKSAGTVRVRLALEAPEPSGRRELVAAASVYGGLLSSGLATTIREDLKDRGGLVLGIGAGGALIGFAGSYLGTRSGVTVGTSSAVIGSGVWGLVGGALVADAAGKDQDTVNAVGLISSIGTSTAAAIAAPAMDLSPGDAAVWNSGGLWGMTTGFLFAASVADDTDPGLSPRLTFSSLLGGLIGGAIIARTSEMSRAHVALIDLAGLAGVASGGALATALRESDTADNPNARTTARFALAGLVIGIGSGIYLTRHYDEDDSSVPVTTIARLVPMVAPLPEGGGMAMWAGGWE